MSPERVAARMVAAIQSDETEMAADEFWTPPVMVIGSSVSRPESMGGPMKHRWVSRDIAVPADVMWELLVDVRHWPEWGPSVRHATLTTSRLELGSRGTVRTVIGLELPFEVTRFEPGRSWSWAVASCPATDHVVEARGPLASWVAFGVPWIAAPYLAVCGVALRRLEKLGEQAITSPRPP
jgi:hypothetical protein